MVKDDPPTYKSVVEGVSPPGYLASIINEQINPVLNKEWARRLHEQSVCQEVHEVVSASAQQQIYCIETGQGESSRADNPSP